MFFFCIIHPFIQKRNHVLYPNITGNIIIKNVIGGQLMRRRSPARFFITITTVSALFAMLRLISVNGVAAKGVISEFVSQEGVAERLLDYELSGHSIGVELAAVFFTYPNSPEPTAFPTVEKAKTRDNISDDFTRAEEKTETEPPVSKASDSGELYYQGAGLTPYAGTDNSAPLPSDGIVLQNTSGFEIDIERLLTEPLELNLAEDGPQVLIIHTHASEAFTQAPGEEYVESDPFRTQDKTKSILYVGDVLSDELSARGISVVHDRGTYDYPSYAGAYNRTLEAIRGYLEKYPSISLVIDLHRDARAAEDGDQYKTVAEINGSRCSQIMLVAGTNAAGLEHPEWEQNMKLALRVQHEMNRSYPSLARPVGVSQYRYNQHMTTGSLIVEVGAAGNTLSESVDAIRYFAEAYANVVTG